MKTILKSFHAVLLAVVTITYLSGCASMEPQAGTPQASALMCNKCQTVWVPSQNRGGKPGDYRAYSGSRKMICPQCESMAATFFRTGQFRHSCPGCGGKVTRCAVQTLGTKMAASSRP